MSLLMFVIFFFSIMYYIADKKDNIINIDIKNTNENKNISSNNVKNNNITWETVNKSLMESKHINRENSIFVDEIKKARREAFIVAQMYENNYKRLYEEINVGICTFNRETGIILKTNQYFFNIYYNSKVNNKKLEDHKNPINIYNCIDDLHFYISKKTDHVVNFKIFNNEKVKVRIYVCNNAENIDECIVFITELNDLCLLNDKLKTNLDIIYKLFTSLDVELYMYHKNKGIIKILNSNIINSFSDLVYNVHDLFSLNYYFTDKIFVNELHNNINKVFTTKRENLTYTTRYNNKNVTIVIVPDLYTDDSDIANVILHYEKSPEKKIY